MLRIHNSQSRTKEPFAPLDPTRVGIYTCGPTVYDSLHLGHARAAIVPDIVRRYLDYLGFHVRFVVNFTDVDDKIIRRAIDEERDWRELTATYIAEYHRLMFALGNKPADVYPRCTDHIAEMIDLVQRLLDGGHAYVAADGDVYFETASYARYGRLSGRKLDDAEAGMGMGMSGRISHERLAVKKNPADFVLWKLQRNDKAEIARGGDAVPRWSSPWGDGRPGWHTECSAMSRKYLGVPFDIHCGGQDLLFPHHEDEKAQSDCAYADELNGAEVVRYWIHNGFLTMPARPEDKNLDSELADAATGSIKMSKSLGNVKWVREIIWPDGPFDPMAVRMMLLSSHYRSPIVFSPALLHEATARLERIYNALEAADRALADAPPAAEKSRGTPTNPTASVGEAVRAFENAMNDDFNTPEALAAIFGLVSDLNQRLAGRDASALADEEAAGVRAGAKTLRRLLFTLGLREHRSRSEGSEDSDKLVHVLLQARHAAREAKQFALADKIRDDLNQLGYEIEDLPGGKWNVKR